MKRNLWLRRSMLCRKVVMVITLILASIGVCAEHPLIDNSSFEAVRQAKPDSDGLVNLWKLGDAAKVPQNWQLNVAYPGQLLVGTDAPHSGKRFASIAASGKRSAHLYQMCMGLKAGEWYRVSLWVRGGPVIVGFYEYYQDSSMGWLRVFDGKSKGDKWRQLTGYYRPSSEGYLRSALAVQVESGYSADVDDVIIEPIGMQNGKADYADITYENDVARITITATGMLKLLQRKGAADNYAAQDARIPVFSVVRNGVTTPVRSVSQNGEVLNLRFLDPDITVSLRVIPRKHHFLIEVVDVSPDDVEEFTIELPVRRLTNIAGALNSTYDNAFGSALFGTTANTHSRGIHRSNDVSRLRVSCYRKHGMTGASFAFVAAPFVDFSSAIMEAERENGLPSPILDGKWARESDPVRRSYLFATRTTEADIDTLIKYAKVGGFETILILKDDWLANHGHFDINTKNFPDGIESIKRAVKKIHDAGLYAGAHVYGPSISPNDSYVTPKPDGRLAYVSSPPLADAVDEKMTTLTLAEQPNLPPKTVRTRAFPGYYIRIGDEIIRYHAVEVGPPFRFLNCQRGALGTKATPHSSGTKVKGLLTVWNHFLVNPDSTLADELTQNFANVFNAADFDMVYFDASDGIQDVYLDRWYYLNKMHLAFYHKFKKDVLYQTSNGTGSDLLWHIVPRGASADGHGDIKGYLDQRWPIFLSQSRNFTRSDIGWYYWFKDVRPDQMEYVAAKAMGVDGSISVETSRTAMETLTQSRQMFEMLERWEKCRLANYFPETVKAKLREPRKDFKLFTDGSDGWQLYRAVYEDPRIVDVLDGEQNHWTINNDLGQSCDLGVEIVRGKQQVAVANYRDQMALTIETFEDTSAYKMSHHNHYEKYVAGGGKVLTQNGPVHEGVTQAIEGCKADAKVGKHCLLYSAENKGITSGWGVIGRRFEKPLDLSQYKGIGMWIYGDNKYETLLLQFYDVSGNHASFSIPINFKDWHLVTFPLATGKSLDWSGVEYLLLQFKDISAKTSVHVRLDDIKMLTDLKSPPEMGQPVLTVNEQRIVFPTKLDSGQALTSEGANGAMLWPGGMKPGRPLELPAIPMLKPGKNEVTFSHTGKDGFPGNVSILLYRLWPLNGPD